MKNALQFIENVEATVADSCAALVEHLNGRLDILEWAKRRSWSMVERMRLADAEAPAA